MPIHLNRAPKMPTGDESDVQSVTIRRHDNGGATVECETKQPESDGEGMSITYRRPKTAAFADARAAFKFAEGKFLGGTSGDDYDEEPTE